ncbi:MAG: DUF4124 domain-containing protein [Halioglobus sp.]
MALSESLLRAMLLVTLLMTASVVSIAQSIHYRWLDDRGNPVHSDRPPPKGTDYQVVETGSSIVRQVTGNTGAVPAETAPRVGNNFEPINTAPEQKRPNPEYCKRARENLAAMNSGAQINIKDDQGETRVLTPDQVETERDKAKDLISAYCR